MAAAEVSIGMNAVRILIISDEGPQTGTAGGLLLHRLLAGHPPSCLRVLARYVPTLGDPLPGVEYRQLTTPWMRFERSRFNRTKRSLRAWGLVPPPSMRRLDALVAGFQPEVVLCVMQHASYYDTALRFARSRRLPLVVIVHDVNDDFEPVLPWARAAALRRDGAFYRSAARRLCVSPEMETYCRERYRAGGDVLYPNRGADLKPVAFELAQRLRVPGRLTVAFAGNLAYGYGRELCRHLPALRAAGARLVVYSRPPGADCAALGTAADCVELRGFKPAAQVWQEIQRDCDLVWLPYPSPALEFERLYRYHFPSKLPEYLALGLPVLVSGPAYATGVRWAIRHSGAVVARADPAPEDLAALFRELTADGESRHRLAAGGWEAGQQDFDPARIVHDFHRHLAAAARPPP
ncbi:MAG: glycosyltransferase [Opitutaceae bacterium]|nr:glycosyltransferase [Opitutaceae bacterium]